MPSNSGGASAPITSVICAPQSPPCATNRVYPRRLISAIQAPTIWTGPQPVAVGFPENPQPGIDGTTTSNASSASPPCAVGSVSGPTTFSISMTEPGQPSLLTTGNAYTS